MAIDSRNRRASCLAVAVPVLLTPPAPDGSLGSLEDRSHLAYRYSGGTITVLVSTVPTLSVGIIYVPGLSVGVTYTAGCKDGVIMVPGLGQGLINIHS